MRGAAPTANVATQKDPTRPKPNGPSPAAHPHVYIRCAGCCVRYRRKIGV